MNCPKCSSALKNEARFCTHCGTRLEEIYREPKQTPMTEPQQTISDTSTGCDKPCLLQAKGRDGSVSFDGVTIVIDRHGMISQLTHFAQGQKRIPVSSIQSVDWKEPSIAITGLLGFRYAGGGAVSGSGPDVLGNIASAGKNAWGIIGGIADAASTGNDENTVRFDNKDRDAFARIRDAVEQSINERLSGQMHAIGGGGSAVQPPHNDVAAALKQLAELHSAGVLSDEEFVAAKRKVIGY